MSKIPINRNLYNNDPDLLNAILYCHFEDVIASEHQVYEEEELNQENQSFVASINLGLSTQSVMRHLVKIYKQVLKVREIKKKIENDPLNSKAHEKEMWLQYNKVTEHK